MEAVTNNHRPFQGYPRRPFRHVHLLVESKVYPELSGTVEVVIPKNRSRMRDEDRAIKVFIEKSRKKASDFRIKAVSTDKISFGENGGTSEVYYIKLKKDELKKFEQDDVSDNHFHAVVERGLPSLINKIGKLVKEQGYRPLMGLNNS